MISSDAHCVREELLSVVQTLRGTRANLVKPLPWRTNRGFDLLIAEASWPVLSFGAKITHFIQLFDTVDAVFLSQLPSW